MSQTLSFYPVLMQVQLFFLIYANPKTISTIRFLLHPHYLNHTAKKNRGQI